MTIRKISPVFRRPAWLLRLARRLGLRRVIDYTLFYIRLRRFPDFERTRYYNDHLFQVKGRIANDVLRSFTSDKEFVKIFAHGVLGRDVSVPTLAVLRSVAEVDIFDFPVPCVVKPTHMSQAVLMLRDAPSDEDRGLMKEWLGRNYADYTLETQYQNLERKLIVEPLLEFDGEIPRDFKFYTFGGEVKAIEVMTGRFQEPQNDFYTRDWRPAEISSPHFGRRCPEILPRPECLEEMVRIAEQLGARFPSVRVDLYTDGRRRIYLGELTHISCNAHEQFRPVEAERYFIDGVPEHAVREVPASSIAA